MTYDEIDLLIHLSCGNRNSYTSVYCLTHPQRISIIQDIIRREQPEKFNKTDYKIIYRNNSVISFHLPPKYSYEVRGIQRDFLYFDIDVKYPEQSPYTKEIIYNLEVRTSTLVIYKHNRK